MENAPELLRGLELYETAFQALDRERPKSLFGQERITRRAMREYAEDYGFDKDQYDMLLHVVVEMDDVLLAWRAKRKVQ